MNTTTSPAAIVVGPAPVVDYDSMDTPPGYVCGSCRKSGVKLWRHFQAFLEGRILLCADCAAATAVVDISTMDEQGVYVFRQRFTTDPGMRTNRIGWRIPAVLRPNGISYWGYLDAATPVKATQWWERLPIR